MPNQDDDFRRRLLATFRIEADEHLQAMTAGLLGLEKGQAADVAALVESVFREAHSLKGAARAVNFKEVEQACQALESVFSALKDGRLALSASLFDLLHDATGKLGKVVASGGERVSSADAAMLDALVQRLDAALHGIFTAATAAPRSHDAAEESGETPPHAEPGGGERTVRVATGKLDKVMHLAEEMLLPQLAAAQRAGELRALGQSLAAQVKRQARLYEAWRAQERHAAKAGAPAPQAAQAGRLREYLAEEQRFMAALESRLVHLGEQAESDARALAAMVDGLLREVKELHQLPFTALLQAFPRMARELAREQNKLVALAVRGGEVEIDRRILDEMRAPLLHLLRNCLDHGIEAPAVREGKGKPAQGNIGIDVEQYDSGRIALSVSDDGAGVDVDGLKAAAIRLGVLAREDAATLAEQEALALAFHSGITTSDDVTALSGRGLGLAIVREKVEQLGGEITLASRRSGGATFRMVLPLTLATLRGVLVRLGERQYLVPALSVERVLQVQRSAILTLGNRTTIAVNGQTVALVHLGAVLELPSGDGGKEAAAKVQVLLLANGDKRIAFAVDEIEGEQEVLVKGLGRQLVRVRNVAGASVLGSGQLAVVLNVPDLLKSAVRQGGRLPQPLAAKPALAERRSILLVEDSITSRMLLKNILESGAYRVGTAVDGADAWEALQTRHFDLVVSDVEMPRMDGFDLTARVRADSRLAKLPVILVTALESREQRERGFDVGANAYIAKRGFDPGELLEAVRRLI